jgi:hypothetical protein
MANEIKTNLRQANAKAFVAGIVSEKELKTVTEDGKTKITGHITVKTSDVNFIKFSVNANEKTNEGKDNKCYAGIQTVMNEYKSIAEVGEEEATEVRVTGDINPFTGKDGSKIVLYKSNFFNRLKAGEELEPKAEFSVEMFITNIGPELAEDDTETGRIVVSGWMPTYNGIEPLELVAEGEVGQAIDSSFEPGQTVEFYGQIINNRIETVEEIPVKIGKPRRKVTVEYKNDLIIEGASEAYEKDVTKEEPYEEKTIRAAIQERDNKLAELKAKAQGGGSGGSTAKPSGKAKGRALGF